MELDANYHRKRMANLEARQSSWRSHWRRIADNVRPRSARWYAQEAETAGQEKGQHIVNSTPTMASRTLSAGLMSGITSPSRPWFRLGLSERELSAGGAAKQYLTEVRDGILEAFAKSNVYAALAHVYSDLADYGTALLVLDEDEEDTLRAYTYPIGSYFLEASDRLAVDTVYRRTTMTVRQLVLKFGRDAVSQSARDAYDRGEYETPLEVGHCVYANPKPGPEKQWELEPTSRPYLSAWWEQAPGADGARFLLRSGYRERPFAAPRWETTGEDVYGSSPGMTALGDCEALQVLERRAAQMFEKLVNPPMVAPSSLQHRRVSLLPGGVTYLATVSASDVVRPAHEVPVQAPAVAAAQIREHEMRIQKAYFADLWLLMAQSEGQMTAREVSERREEKMLQLGAVLEKLQDELLEPLISRAFGILNRAGKLPPPPEELQGQPFKVEYVSMMAAAQKMLGLTAIDRTAALTAQLAAAWPQALDKVDVDEVVDVYADMTGVPPSIVRPDDEVERLRAQRAKMAQQQAAAEAAPQAAQTAKTLADTDMDSNSALNQLLRNVGAR